MLKPTILVLVSSSALCLSVIAAETAYGEAILRIDNSVSNVAQALQSDVVDFPFRVGNVGDAALTVQVKPSCGCTVAEYDKTIEPGKEGVIRAKLDTKGMKGLVRKSLTVLTNDPEHKSTTLWISVNVETPIDIFPEDRLYFQAKPGETKSFHLVLTSDESAAFEVKKVTSSRENIRVKCTSVQGTGGKSSTHYLRVDVPCDSLGAISGSITVETTHPKAPTLRIPVSGIVRPRFELTPPSASFGTVKVDEKKELLLILSWDEEGSMVKTATGDKPYIAASMQTLEEGKVYLLRLQYTGGAAKGILQGIVNVETTNKSQPLLAVPFVGRVE